MRTVGSGGFIRTARRFGHASGVESAKPVPLDWSPAGSPSRIALNGDLVRLETLDPPRHAESLYTSSHGEGSEVLWQHLPYGPFAIQEAFNSWLADRAASADPLFFAVVDSDTMRALGMASFMRMDPPNGVIEIGHIWFAPELQRTRQATEAIYLLAKTAFDDLGYRRLEWKCDSLNMPSRRAADRFGFTFEGIFRQHMIVKGRNRDTAWFSITDGEWPTRKAAFEAWLAPDNFDGAGKQRRALSELRSSIQSR
jgi:RimJ/RimL family protein N-acetyltransferase